jgi:hypothetical protein
MCRSSFLPLQAYKIFKNKVIKPIALQTFAMEKDSHGYVFDCMRLANKIGQRGQWHANVLHSMMVMFDQNAEDTNRLSNAMILFQQALLHDI